jgi:hypothetical protein
VVGAHENITQDPAIGRCISSRSIGQASEETGNSVVLFSGPCPVLELDLYCSQTDFVVWSILICAATNDSERTRSRSIVVRLPERTAGRRDVHGRETTETLGSSSFTNLQHILQKRKEYKDQHG